MPNKLATKKIEVKTVTINGIKYLEKSMKKVVPVSDYGQVVIKGSEIIGFANLGVGFKIDNNTDYIMLKGYLNNKLIPGTTEPAKDSYGDIPTGSNVYDVKRLESNPVALVNHMNDASGIAGNYIYLSENEQGLQFKLILRPIDSIHAPITKDAVQAWADGFGKAFSIGGQWLYDLEKSRPEDNEWILVKAILHEASLVAIGADQWALSSVPDTSSVETEGKEIKDLTLGESVKKYLETNDDAYLERVMEIKKERGKKNV